jgi:Methyltransferase domain
VTHPRNDFGLDPDGHDTAAILYRMARATRGTVLLLGRAAVGVSRALSALDEMKVTVVVSDLSALGSESSDGLETFVSDPEMANWHTVLEGRTYDVTIVADLLEYLRDPERVLRDLREQRLLSADGRLLVSFANVAHPAVEWELLSGDYSRVRWYTLDSMTRLLEASGYVVVETHHTRRPRRPFTTDEELQTYEYVLQARPNAAGTQLALLRRQLDEATQRLAEAESAREQISALLDEERAAFRDEIRRGAEELEHVRNKIDQMRDERSALREETARLHGELAGLQRQVARLEDELAVASEARQTTDQRLAAIQQSRSYRWSRRLAKTVGPALAALRSAWDTSGRSG